MSPVAANLLTPPDDATVDGAVRDHARGSCMAVGPGAISMSTAERVRAPTKGEDTK